MLQAELDAPDVAVSACHETPIARLYGEPLFVLPKDLYIPPQALEIFLEAFEGPLDLLLYLIRRQNFNILDIPMTRLTAQYLSYIEEVKSQNLELAAEYLLMAALLIEIKSRMLLPAQKVADDEENEDPRAELVRRLLEYERIKKAAAALGRMAQFGRDFLPVRIQAPPNNKTVLPSVSTQDLQHAMLGLRQRKLLQKSHKITREQLSVREYMSHVLRRLNGRRFAQFQDLLVPDCSTAVVIVTLIALLELARESLVDITQAEAYAPIYIRLGFTPD